MNKQELKLARHIAEELLKIKAVKLQPTHPFTWASGWKSPIYCDNRKSLSHVGIRDVIKFSLIQKIEEKYPTVDAIAAVATAGIPWGSSIADYLGLPFAYVRSTKKDHGLENKIEGDLIDNSNVVVIEDLLSTGSSSTPVVEALREAGHNVLGLEAIFSHGFPQVDEAFQKINCQFSVLCNYEITVGQAIATGYITETEQAALAEWRKDPANWRNDLK